MANDKTIALCPLCKAEINVASEHICKHAGGRPTLYSEEMLQKSREYIANCIDKIQLDGEKIVSIGVNLPKAEGLAKHLGVHRDTLYEWAKVHEEFSDILEAINQEQIERLINGGLSGKYNATIVKLVLAKHGYKESTESETTHKGEISIRDLFDRSK